MAIVPFWIMLVFIPLMMHERVPLPLAQVMVLEAAVAALPADALRLTILAVLYVKVHCTAAGSFPEGEASVRFNVVLPPLTVLEDNDRLSV